jgi:hypothetical protein
MKKLRVRSFCYLLQIIDYKIMTELNNAVFRKISSACAARFRR